MPEVSAAVAVEAVVAAGTLSTLLLSVPRLLRTLVPFEMVSMVSLFAAAMKPSAFPPTKPFPPILADAAAAPVLRNPPIRTSPVMPMHKLLLTLRAVDVDVDVGDATAMMTRTKLPLTLLLSAALLRTAEPEKRLPRPFASLSTVDWKVTSAVAAMMMIPVPPPKTRMSLPIRSLVARPYQPEKTGWK